MDAASSPTPRSDRARFALCLAVTPLLAGADRPPRDTETWYRIVAADGAAIGHARSEARRGPAGVESISEQQILVDNGEANIRTSERKVVRDDRSGRPVSISEYSTTGRSWSRIEARIGRDKAEITRSTSTDRRSAVVALAPGVRFDSGLGLMRGWDRAAVPRLEFDNLNVAAMMVERVVIEPGPGAPGPDGSFSAVRRRYEGGELRAVGRLTLGPDGRVRSMTQPMMGTSVTLSVSDRETALKPHSPYRLLQSAMVKSPFRISPEAMRGRIRYRFAYRDGLAFPFPVTSEQRASASAEGVLVDICADCGPGLATDKAALDEALRPTAWLQSDHPRLRAIARPIARMATNDSRKMSLLAAKARPYLATIDFAGHFSALETLDRRAGDCTEAAVLLAALGRSAGIPTRVASGLVYSRERYHGVTNSFMPHSWTLAYVDGSWRSFDLALDTFDSTHIALTLGDGDSRSILAAGQLASLLEWKEMSEVRPRPGRPQT
ncbi:MAG TPA: transglutaminase-like domain-containing protein [Allosphingosinicella sp.]|nr:transglutaminase-like domain-containing protein [Allosphingosinicella sp.]